MKLNFLNQNEKNFSHLEVLNYSVVLSVLMACLPLTFSLLIKL